MAVKTFAVGEVLTASDTNTYLNNGGLVYVTSKTWTSTSSAQQIDFCFTSTYDNYRVLFTGTGDGASPTNINCKLVDGTTPASTNYYFMVQYQNTANVPYSYWSGVTTNWQVGWIGNTGVTNEFTFDILGPQLTTATTGHSTGFGAGTSQFTAGTYFCMNTNLTAYEGLWLQPVSGTWSGTITVYGYRKA